MDVCVLTLPSLSIHSLIFLRKSLSLHLHTERERVYPTTSCLLMETRKVYLPLGVPDGSGIC